MQLLAGSLNVEVDGFLHAGYLSAYPRSFEQVGPYQVNESKAEVVDVAAALALKSEHSSAATNNSLATATVSPAPLSVPTASVATNGFMLGVAVLFFAWLTAVYFRRFRQAKRPRWMTWVLMPSFVVVLTVIVMTAIPLHREYQQHRLNSLPPPWKHVAVREYEDPELATETILRSLVAPGLANCPMVVTHLTAIQYSVGFPVPREQLTEGMAYALKTYGLDGWGKEFSFSRHRNGSYRIVSAGPDGKTGNRDDIVYETPPPDHYNWELFVNGFFVRNVGDEDRFVIRRVAHRLYRPANAQEARRLTGTDTFDVFRIESLNRNKLAVTYEARSKDELPEFVVKLNEYRETRHAQSKSGSESQSDPLLFIYLPRRDT